MNGEQLLDFIKIKASLSFEFDSDIFRGCDIYNKNFESKEEFIETIKEGLTDYISEVMSNFDFNQIEFEVDE